MHNLSSFHLSTHNLLTHNLSSQNLLTHNLLTHNLLTHNLSSHHLLTHNLSSHNLLTHNLLTHNLSSHHLLTHNLSSHNLLWRGRRGRRGTGLALVARLVLDVAPWRRGVLAGVALGDIHRHFVWQAWHLVTSTVTLRGRRGTHGIGLALVARLALGVAPWRRGVLRGRRGTWRHVAALWVAGTALGDM